MKKQSSKSKRRQMKRSKKRNRPKKKKKSIRKVNSLKKTVATYYQEPKLVKSSEREIFGNETTIDSNPNVVFPFVSIKNFGSKTKSKYYNPEGTGFFINELGLFVTAKHVPYYQEKSLRSFIAIHSHGKLVSVRHVKNFVYHPTADIAIGFLDKYDPKNKVIYSNKTVYNHLVPNFDIPKIGDDVKNFGYGGSSVENKDKRIQDATFPCQWNVGKVTELYLNGRDRATLPGANIEAQMPTMGKASGGPVFDKEGKVIGVNSTSIPGEPPVSNFTPINQILDLEIEHETLGLIKVSDLFK